MGQFLEVEGNFAEKKRGCPGPDLYQDPSPAWVLIGTVSTKRELWKWPVSLLSFLLTAKNRGRTPQLINKSQWGFCQALRKKIVFPNCLFLLHRDPQGLAGQPLLAPGGVVDE